MGSKGKTNLNLKEKYKINSKNLTFNQKESLIYSNNKSFYTCQIKGHIVNKNKNKHQNRSPSPIPSNIQLNINNKLKLDTTSKLPKLCLDYLFIPTDNNYTKNNPAWTISLQIHKYMGIP